MKEIIKQSLEAIYIYIGNFIEEINIFSYVLFGIYIRDG